MALSSTPSRLNCFGRPICSRNNQMIQSIGCVDEPNGSQRASLRHVRVWRACDGLMGVEPLPDIRDGILVERLVKTMRYVPDMRCCQYVVQRPEGVRRRQRLNVEYVDRRAGYLLVP